MTFADSFRFYKVFLQNLSLVSGWNNIFDRSLPAGNYIVLFSISYGQESALLNLQTNFQQASSARYIFTGRYLFDFYGNIRFRVRSDSALVADIVLFWVEFRP